MRFSALLFLLTCLSPLALAQDTDIQAVRAMFEKYNIPAALGINFRPFELLNIQFPVQVSPTGPTMMVPVKAGDTLPRNNTAGPPLFTFGGGPAIDPSPKGPLPVQFVIIAVDPDAPTPENPTNSQIRHFLGGSFVPNPPLLPASGLPRLVNLTAAVTEYRQPTPPASTLGSPHRYIFLAYMQNNAFSNQTVVTPKSPINLWDVAKFTQAVGLGDPIAGTFFLVKPETLA